MNMVNATTRYSPFQLCMGRSPRTLPPLIPSHHSLHSTSDSCSADHIIQQLHEDVAEAQDHMLQAKVTTSHYTNQHQGPEDVFVPGNLVMLLTFHCCHEYTQRGDKRTVKFLMVLSQLWRHTLKCLPTHSSSPIVHNTMLPSILLNYVVTMLMILHFFPTGNYLILAPFLQLTASKSTMLKQSSTNTDTDTDTNTLFDGLVMDRNTTYGFPHASSSTVQCQRHGWRLRVTGRVYGSFSLGF